MAAWGINQSFSVFFKPLVVEFGWGHADTVLAFSIAALVMAGIAIVTGWLADKLGPRIVIMVFGSFLGIAYLLLSRVNSLWQFVIIYGLVASIGLSAVNAPIVSTIARWFTRKRGVMTAIVQSGVGIGGFIFAPFTGWLIAGYGWRPAYCILGIIVLIVILVSGALLRRDPGETGKLPEDVSDASMLPGSKHKPGTQTAGFTFREAVRTQPFWIITGIYFIFGFCRSTFLPHIAAHVQDLGFSLADGANVVALLTVSSIAGRFWLGWFGNRSAFLTSFAVTSIALVWALYTRELWGLYLFAVIFGFGWGAQAVLRYTIAVDTVGLVSIGLLLGIWGFAEAGASALGSYMAGYLFDVTGSYKIAFIAGIPISIAGIIMSAMLKPIAKVK